MRSKGISLCFWGQQFYLANTAVPDIQLSMSSRSDNIMRVLLSSMSMRVCGLWRCKQALLEPFFSMKYNLCTCCECEQALLNPFSQAAALTRRPALLARLQSGVFEQLLSADGSSALCNLDTKQLASRLFELGGHPFLSSV
jgi:hypothetical protein